MVPELYKSVSPSLNRDDKDYLMGLFSKLVVLKGPSQSQHQ